MKRHLAADCISPQEVVHEGEVIGSEDHRRGRHVSVEIARARRNAVGYREVSRGPAHTTIQVLACARARGSGSKILRPGVAVDLLAHRGQIAQSHASPTSPATSTLRVRARRRPSPPAGSRARTRSSAARRHALAATPSGRRFTVQVPAPNPAGYAHRARSSRLSRASTTGAPSTSAWNGISQRSSCARRLAAPPVEARRSAKLHRENGVDGL